MSLNEKPEEKGSQSQRSPEPSHVSVKSDRSMDHRNSFSDKPDKRCSRSQRSPQPSRVSVKSGRSMGHPLDLSDKPVTTDPM